MINMVNNKITSTIIIGALLGATDAIRASDAVNTNQDEPFAWVSSEKNKQTFSAINKVAAITKLVGDEGREQSLTGGSDQMKEQPDAYLDQLIDPAVLSLEPEESSQSEKNRSSAFNFHQAIEAVIYHQDIDEQNSVQEQAIAYNAYIPTNNYGDLRIQLVAIDDSENRRGALFAEDAQQGISRFSIQQLALPISETLSMDNIIGTHRTNYLPAQRYSTGLINQRFGAVEPDILGLTSRLNYKFSSLTASYGEVGENRGSLLPGFVGLDGKVGRLQLNTVTDHNAYSLDFWNTREFIDESKNRDGFRGNWSAIWKDSLVSNVSLAKSGDSNAVLLGLTKKQRELRQEVGIYYFDPDFNWINKRIGDNNNGIYYRMSNRRGALGYGFNFEFREDGIKGDATPKRDTLFLSSNGNYRLNRVSRIGANYSFRNVTQTLGLRSETKQHLIRVNYSTQYNANTNGNFGADYRQREVVGFSAKDKTERLIYSVSHDFLNDSSAELGLEYSAETTQSDQSKNYRINAGWNRSLSNNSSLSLGASYNQTASNQQHSNYWQAQASWNHQLTEKLSLSANIDYNRSIYELDDDVDFSGLFTDNDFDNNPFQDREIGQFSATLRIAYNFGNATRGTTLSPKTGKAGSGSIRGRLFYDENNDGVKQLNEPGVSGVAVYLDSIHPTTSRPDGTFDFQRVGSGDHQIFIDERRLPLPYQLNGVEFTPVTVRLRKVNSIDIPLYKLP